MSSDELADRLTEEVTALSTKLVTAVSKQAELEEKLVMYHRENAALKSRLDRLDDFEAKYNDVSARFGDLQTRFGEVDAQKNVFEDENRKLNVEVEELTASLFDEANKMVSDASRETYNFKVKNRKLIEEIDEKNAIIDSLQTQLVDLRKMFETLEDENLRIKNDAREPGDLHVNASVFAPRLKSIRLDLHNYLDFKEFLYTIMQPSFAFDLASLKLTRFFKRVWLEELEQSIPIPATNILTRWQKGKFFWNLLVEGKLKIEPLKGINETLKVDYTGHEKNSVPIAARDMCSFCEEARDDNLEHSRLHVLKLLNPENTEPAVIGEYPLCNYCLIKIRNICDLFAKLRWYTKNGYKLPNTKLESLTAEDECKVVKMYLTLLSIRARIWWSKAGYWDNAGEVTGVNVEDMHIDDFRLMLAEDEKETEKEKAQQDTAHDSESLQHKDSNTAQQAEARLDQDEAHLDEDPSSTPDHVTEQFQDAQAFPDEPALNRTNSQSKSFRLKVDSGLDETLQMLKESIDEAT